jgi:hypothetical protein
MTESRTKKLVAFEEDQIRQWTRDIGKLFMDMGGVDLDPQDRVNDGQRRIEEARSKLAALREQYPKERFQKVHGLFDALEASCDIAEGRMQRFKKIRLPDTKNGRNN